MKIEEMKKVLSDGFPILTSIEEQPIVILGYDDDKESFFCQDYGTSRTLWVTYSTTLGECWYITDDLRYFVIEGDN